MTEPKIWKMPDISLPFYNNECKKCGYVYQSKKQIKGWHCPKCRTTNYNNGE